MALSFLVLGYAIGVSSLDDTARIHTLWLRKLTPESDLETAKAQHTEVMGKLVHDEFVSIYPILFWFLLLGPAGALLYRLTDQFRRSGDLNEDESRLVNSLLHAMDWLPVRISGLAFCVVGDFGRCLDRVLGFFSEWKLQARQVLSEMVEVAITDIEVSTDGVIHFAAKAGFQVSEVRGLFHRTLMFWIALIAVITLLGWV